MKSTTFDRWWRLSVAIAVLPALCIAGAAAADEAFPGPRIPRPYEQQPRVLAADPAATAPPGRPANSLVMLQPDPKPAGKPKTAPAASGPEDSDYKPSSIRDVGVDITEKPGATAPALPMIRYSTQEIAALDSMHFSSQPVFLTRLNGTWIHQRLSGPVAPFCFLPTYFEDDSLNRFGHSHGHLIQPVYSAAQFYVSVPMLPYLMQKRHPWDPVCPNYMPPPLTFKGKARKFYEEMTLESVAAEAGAVAAVFLLFP